MSQPVGLKRPITGKCSGSTASAAWGWLTTGEAEARLVAVDVLVLRWCYMDRWLLYACHLVKMVAAFRSVGNSSLTADSQRS